MDNQLQQLLDNLEAAILNWQDDIGLMGCPDISPEDYYQQLAEAESLVWLRFADVIRYIKPSSDVLAQIKRLQANTQALSGLLAAQEPRILFVHMDQGD